MKYLKTLKEAVAEVVADWTAQGRSFSHYEVVKELRQRCNDGKVVLSDKPRKVVGDVVTHYLEANEETRAAVREALSPDYEGQMAGAYTLFAPKARVGVVFGAAPASSTVAPAPAPVQASTLDSDTKDRIRKYVEKNVGYNYGPTVKNVQSALKRGAYYCAPSSKDIIGFLRSEGYDVQSGPIDYARVLKK